MLKPPEPKPQGIKPQMKNITFRSKPGPSNIDSSGWTQGPADEKKRKMQNDDLDQKDARPRISTQDQQVLESVQKYNVRLLNALSSTGTHLL